MRQPKRAIAVIGTNFGDEGKGLLTDFLAEKAGPSTLVVRHNGGAQAGHTVITPLGQRHVFGHVGSGTFVGAPSLLARGFVHNPLLFDREWKILGDFHPKILADPRGLVTTPYDMLVNQVLERARGNARHGSCGVGFNETIERNLTPQFRITAGLLKDSAGLRDKLETIRTSYVQQRLQALGVSNDPEAQELLRSESLLNGYLESCGQFLERVEFVEDIQAIGEASTVIFEGAQGLLLDEFHPWFPHVTRSRTGLPNPVALCEEAGIPHLELIYVTRWYLTRHGAGPFPTETTEKPSPMIEDRTNQPNPWQGSLRFGLLDLGFLRESIQADLDSAPKSVSVTPSLAVTCLDQAGETLTIINNGTPQTIPTSQFHDVVEEQTRLSVGFSSIGPSREDVFGQTTEGIRTVNHAS